MYMYKSHGKLQFKLEMFFNISIEMCENYMFSITAKKKIFRALNYFSMQIYDCAPAYTLCIENEKNKNKNNSTFLRMIKRLAKKYKESV